MDSCRYRVKFYVAITTGGDSIYKVYIIKNNINDKVYIGITSRDIRERFYEHCSYKKDYNMLITRAIHKYGRENFFIEILEDNIPIDIIDKREKEYINKYNSLNPNGYNCDIGGFHRENKQLSEATKRKISESGIGSKNSRFKDYILMLDKDKDVVLNRFESQREAGRFLESTQAYGSIAQALLGYRKNNKSLGYRWYYEKDYYSKINNIAT